MTKIKGVILLKNWTPKTAAKAARSRLKNIELLLQEIGGLYGDVYEPVPLACDEIRDQLTEIEQAIAEAEELEAQL